MIRLPPEQILEICDMFNAGGKPGQIAFAHGLELRQVYYVLREAGVMVGRTRPSILDRYEADVLDSIIIDYTQTQVPLRELLARYNMSSHIFYAIISELGVPLRSTSKDEVAGRKLLENTVVDMYLAGATYTEIEREVGVSRGVIADLVRKHGFEPNRR